MFPWAYMMMRPADATVPEMQQMGHCRRSGLEGLNNGMMASVPQLPLWGLAAQVLKERAHAEGTAEWEKGPIYQTGPRVLGEVLQCLHVQHAAVPHPIDQFNHTCAAVAAMHVPCWPSDPLDHGLNAAEDCRFLSVCCTWGAAGGAWATMEASGSWVVPL